MIFPNVSVQNHVRFSNNGLMPDIFFFFFFFFFFFARVGQVSQICKLHLLGLFFSLSVNLAKNKTAKSKFLFRQ